MKNLKKTWLLLSAFVIAFNVAIGQTFDEWFKQKKTQKKYLIQQIAALKVYSEYVEKGYVIVKNGLNAIDEFKEGKFQLDKIFFSLLENVNPHLRTQAKTAIAVYLQMGIVKCCGKILKTTSSTKILHSSEKLYVNQVLYNLIVNVAATTNELTQLVAPHELKLNDKDRSDRIDATIRDMQNESVFIHSFSDDLQRLIANRNKDVEDNVMLNQLYLK